MSVFHAYSQGMEKLGVLGGAVAIVIIRLITARWSRWTSKAVSELEIRTEYDDRAF